MASFGCFLNFKKKIGEYRIYREYVMWMSATNGGWALRRAFVFHKWLGTITRKSKPDPNSPSSQAETSLSIPIRRRCLHHHTSRESNQVVPPSPTRADSNLSSYKKTFGFQKFSEFNMCHLSKMPLIFRRVVAFFDICRIFYIK